MIKTKKMKESKGDAVDDDECYLPTTYPMDDDIEAALLPPKEPPKNGLMFDSMFMIGAAQGDTEDDITKDNKVQPAYKPKFVHYDELSDDTGEVTAAELAIIRANPLMSRIYIHCHHDLYNDDDISTVTGWTYKTMATNKSAVILPQDNEMEHDEWKEDIVHEFEGYDSYLPEFQVDDEEIEEMANQISAADPPLPIINENCEKSYALSSTYIMKDDDYNNFDDDSLVDSMYKDAVNKFESIPEEGDDDDDSNKIGPSRRVSFSNSLIDRDISKLKSLPSDDDDDDDDSSGEKSYYS